MISSLKPHLKPRAETTTPSSPQPVAPLAVRPKAPKVRSGIDFSVDAKFLLDLLPDYHNFVFPICPITEDEIIRESISRATTEADHGAFCFAYAAMTLALAPDSHPRKTPGIISDLISRALQLRPAVGHTSQIDLKRVALSVFLRISFGVLQDREMDFFYLREAITMIQILHIDKPRPRLPESSNPTAWHHLHWVVFIHDRLSAIADERDGVFSDAPTELPSVDSGNLNNHKIRLGFRHICQLYELVDAEFLSNWRDRNKATDSIQTMEWIETRQKALASQHNQIQEVLPQLSDTHQADLILTSQWLQTLVWQMAGCKYLLHSDAIQDYMLLLFPVQGCIYLKQLLDRICRDSLERQGVGIRQKLFDITDTATDVVTVSAHLHDREVVIHWAENCQHLVRYLLQFKNLHGAQRSLLEQKLGSLSELLIEGEHTHI